MVLTSPSRALQRSLLLSTSLKLLTLSGILLFFTNLFWLAFLLALFDSFNLFVLTNALAWFIKITKVTPFESVKVFCNDSFLAQFFSLYSSMIYPDLYLLLSTVIFMLTIWPSGLHPLGPCCGGGHTRSSDSNEALMSSSKSKQV